MRRPSTLIALVSLTGLASSMLVVTPAHAVPTGETEPNDTIFQVSSTANTEGLTGTVGTSGDVDYFWLGLRPQRQVKILATASGCTSARYDHDNLVVATVVPTDGGDGSELAYLTPSMEAPSDFVTTTTPGVYGGPTQYFLVKVMDSYGDVGCRYNLQVQSATGGTTDAIDPAPPATFPVAPLAEPDDLTSQAHGPLAGETSYAGSIETTNDVDQVFFQVKAGAGLNVRLSTGAGSVYASSDTMEDLSATAGNYDISTVGVSASDQTYRLAITGDAGSTYQLLLTPGTSLGVTPPPPPPPPYFSRSVSIKRKSGAYVGKVRAEDPRCEAATVVTLRKKGHRGSIARTTTSTSGTWRIKRRRTVKRVYATVSFIARDGYECGSARSRVLRRGR